jgi:tRNA-splicing ligase RtcB (3'-phosphate/5'-hydroxy nucleic acid ligase)
LSAIIEPEPSSPTLRVRWLLTPDLMPDASTVERLERLAHAPEIAHPVAVLPDVHAKAGRPTPTGTVVATRDALLPEAVDTGISCGIRMVRSEIDAAGLSPASLDRLFAELMRTIPVRRHERDALEPLDLREILVDGAGWCARRHGSAADLDAVEDGGRGLGSDDPDELLAGVPARALAKAPRCFATLGAGNHFLELQEIVEILDPARAARLGLQCGQAFFMIHTGSRAVGTQTMKSILASLGATDGDRGDAGADLAGRPMLRSLDPESPEGRRAVLAMQAASSFGFANRAALHHDLRAAVRAALNDTGELPLVYDCAHVSIKREAWNGQSLWIHRHGASRALPPSRMADHPVFAHTGQPLPVPGSMGAESYVCVADEGAADAFHSVNHGSGRQLDKPEAAARFSASQVEAEMRERRIRLYRYGQGDIAEQAPAAFKSARRVVEAMESSSLARAVARLRPIAVLKG